MHAAAEEVAEASQRADFMINAINPGIRMINRIGQIIIAVLGGRMLLGGSMTVGVFQAFSSMSTNRRSRLQSWRLW